MKALILLKYGYHAWFEAHVHALNVSSQVLLRILQLCTA